MLIRIDDGIVFAAMTLELDDGKIVHQRQGDCIAQNSTRIASATVCGRPP